MTPLRRALHRWGPLFIYIAVGAELWHNEGEPLHVLGHWLPFSLGLLCGFAVAIIAGTLWVFFAGPIQELIRERFFDPPQPIDVPQAPATGLQGVLVSDIHIDTWGLLGADAPTERRERFLALLAAVKADLRVNSFYLNGDLMDIPLHPNANAPEDVMLDLNGALAEEQGVLRESYDPVLEPLLDLTQPRTSKEAITPIRRSIFQTGNHDIGISGLRYVRPTMPPFLPPVQTVWNPSLLLQSDAENVSYPQWIYIEHGHHWDPLLWLYMRYALLDTLRFGHRKQESQLFSGMQRGGKKGMGAQTRQDDGLPLAPTRGSSSNHFTGDQPDILSTLVRLRYRQAARRTFREFRSQRVQTNANSPNNPPQVRTVLVGHTHHPDRYVFPGGFVYINSGDWSGFTQHCAYCVLDPDGTVRGPFQWENDKEKEFGDPASA
jgi:hypothetical protein